MVSYLDLNVSRVGWIDVDVDVANAAQLRAGDSNTGFRGSGQDVHIRFYLIRRYGVKVSTVPVRKTIPHSVVVGIKTERGIELW